MDTMQAELSDEIYAWRLHLECRTFDDGHRHALIEQLDAFLLQAHRQAKRSERTAGRPCADDYDRSQHVWDMQVWLALRALRDAKRVMGNPHYAALKEGVA